MGCHYSIYDCNLKIISELDDKIILKCYIIGNDCEEVVLRKNHSDYSKYLLYIKDDLVVNCDYEINMGSCFDTKVEKLLTNVYPCVKTKVMVPIKKLNISNSHHLIVDLDGSAYYCDKTYEITLKDIYKIKYEFINKMRVVKYLEKIGDSTYLLDKTLNMNLPHV